MNLVIGTTTITSIVEQSLFGLHELIPAAQPDAIRDIAWLTPDYAQPDGTLIGFIQTFVVEHEGALIVVDTCIGNDKDIPMDPTWSHMTTSFLEQFRAAGFDPDSVDLVVCTHLHLDHVGWNTRYDGERWVPTFPNASYVFDRIEFEHWAATAASIDTTAVPSNEVEEQRLARAQTVINVQVESIVPIVEAGLVRLVDTPHELLTGLRLIPTRGHTPGHVSVEIESDGQRALITGDSFHHPCQIAHPEWSSRVDFDRDASSQTRRSILDELIADNGVIVGSHFAPPWHGRVVRTSTGHHLDTRRSTND